MNPTYVSFVISNKAEGYWGEFIYLVSHASKKHKSAWASGGAAMREQSQTPQLAFCLERHPDDVGSPCSIPQPHATLGAYEPPSCSVNRPSCPGCVTKTPGFVHIKAGTFSRRQIPAHGCVKWSKHSKKQHSPIGGTALQTCTMINLKQGEWCAHPKLFSWQTSSSAQQPLSLQGTQLYSKAFKFESFRARPVFLCSLPFFSSLRYFSLKKMLYFCIIFIPSRIFALIYFGAGF